MACGSIPVLSNLTTTNRWVKNNKNGIIVKDLSPDGVARVVVRAIRIDNDRRERIARINRLAIIHKASFLRYRHKEENFLKKIIISDQKNKAMHSY
jgi:glycosyltransferase involved in cell wall biosynthesis